MRLVFMHARAMTLELLRYPAYVVPTLLVPTAFFLFFATAGGRVEATARTATFAGFAVIGVAFFQFGVGIAAERVSPWEAYLRTLPVGPGVRLGARLASAALFAAAAAALLLATAVSVSSASLSASRWAALAVALAAGTVPFAFLGIAVGYWAPPKAALPIANLLYLVLSYAGGLWTRPSGLPHAVASISRFLPTRALGDALVAAALGLRVDWSAWLSLAGFAAAFATAAFAGYRRDEGMRFA
jgi:ABC-2 type transport system permease protein